MNYDRRAEVRRTPRLPLRSRTRDTIRALVAGVFLAGISPGLSAGEQSSGGWTFSVAPYLWAAGISGEVATLPGLPAADVDESFADIWDDLQFAGMIAGAARKGKLSIAGDLQYVKTEADDNSLAPLFQGEALTSETFIATALAEYLLVERDRSNLWLSGGLRVWSVDTKLELATGLLPGTTIKGDDTWVDPLLGLRGSVSLGQSEFYLIGWSYVGGFGLGSDIMADVLGGVGYQFNDTISGIVGYRWMKVDREEDAFLYDVTQEGTIIGVRFDF